MKDKPSARLQSVTYHKNIPLTVIWELTRRCNLNCVHCYVPPSERRSADGELSIGEIKKILKDLRAAGCMYLIFTGGEIFLRRGITEILSSARQAGFDVRIFTNGTLFDSGKSPLVAKLKTLGISAVEISLYGPREIHDRITGAQGSYSKTVSAIDSLLSSEIKVVVKSPLMKINFHHRRWLYNFARKRGITVRFDPMITLSECGDKGNLELRLNEKNLKKIHREFGGYIFPSDLCLTAAAPCEEKNKTLTNIKPNIFDEKTTLAKVSHNEPLFYCGAGRNFAAISPDGTLYPCLQLKIPIGNLKYENFTELWHPSSENPRGNPLIFIRHSSLPPHSECFNCSHLAYCPRCPGMAFVEEGRFYGSRKSVFCQLARARRSLIVKRHLERN